MTFQVFYKGIDGTEGCATWPSSAAIAQAHAETLERNGYDAEVVILDPAYEYASEAEWLKELRERNEAFYAKPWAA